MLLQLAEVSRRTDDTVARARAGLVGAVRQAAADGMTQAQIAAAIGRSQPEVSRLLHFHGTTPLARLLRRRAGQIRTIVKEAGSSDVRVSGQSGHRRRPPRVRRRLCCSRWGGRSA